MSILLYMDTGMPTYTDTPEKKSVKPVLLYLLFAFFCLGIVGLGYYVFLGTPNPVVEKVGAEKIYQKDLSYEMSQLPPQAKLDKKQILEKMATDSIILQAGAKMHLVTLTGTIFNSPIKNYPKRIEAVKEITQKIQNQTTHISGTAILMFFQNGEVGPLGYDKSKAITLEKISKIHKDIKDKKITMAQGIEQIQKDTSLKVIDPAYVTNASYTFDVEKGEPPTKINVLNDLLWKVPENTITDIYTDQERNISDKKILPNNRESYYMFVILTKKIVNPDIASYTTWLSQQKKLYEVISY